MIKEKLQERLDALTTELVKGQKRIKQIDQERLSVERTILRIEGAIQLLGELIENDPDQDVTQSKSVESNVATL